MIIVFIEVEIDKIMIGDRFRKELGDIEALAKSIDNVGLINPIMVTTSNRLVTGRRRVDACRLLGWKTIMANVVDTDRLLQTEFDENMIRKNFNKVEALRIGMALEEEERERAKERQIELGKTQGTPSGESPEGSKGQTRDHIGKKIGMSGWTYERGKKVLLAEAQEPEKYKEVVLELEKGGNVLGAFKKVEAIQYGREVKESPPPAEYKELEKIIRMAKVVLRSLKLRDDWVLGLRPRALVDLQELTGYAGTKRTK